MKNDEEVETKCNCSKEHPCSYSCICVYRFANRGGNCICKAPRETHWENKIYNLKRKYLSFLESLFNARGYDAVISEARPDLLLTCPSEEELQNDKRNIDSGIFNLEGQIKEEELMLDTLFEELYKQIAKLQKLYLTSYLAKTYHIYKGVLIHTFDWKQENINREGGSATPYDLKEGLVKQGGKNPRSAEYYTSAKTKEGFVVQLSSKEKYGTKGIYNIKTKEEAQAICKDYVVGEYNILDPFERKA